MPEHPLLKVPLILCSYLQEIACVNMRGYLYPLVDSLKNAVAYVAA
jgi:hypothetical protein